MNTDDPVIPRDVSAQGRSSVFYRYLFANVEYDESVAVLRVSGKEVAIEPRPRNLLLELLRRPNEVISKDELLELLWDSRPTVDNVLATAVNRLRRALGEEGASRIVSVARLGYRLDGPVERVATGTRMSAAAELAAGLPVFEREGYRLERPLGRGAHGEVWLARHPKLHETRVFKFATDSERLTALKREYTLYRVLRSELGERHDFARVLSANFSNAPYYLECEYGGQDLLTWAAEGDRLSATPRPQRLALFVQIGKAVAAAHGVGVLHKDLKPANILVAAGSAGMDDWSIKLTDFGSSRLLDPARLAQLNVTAMGLTMTQATGADGSSGTPLYLAPELLAGQAPSMRSDLYALGLMLYQLLVGDLHRPMATGWQRDIDDALLVETLTASTEGRVEERLGSVEEFVAQLVSLDERRAERALQLQKSRQAAEALEAVRRARDRRPWLIGAFGALLVGLASSLWFYNQARVSLHDARQQAARAQSINDFLNKDVLQSADISALEVKKPASMLEVLHSASERASERFRGDPVTEASVRVELGKVFGRIADSQAAEAEYRRALALLASAVPARDPSLVLVRFQLARQLAIGSRLGEAKEQLEAAERDAGTVALQGDNEVALRAAMARFTYLFMHQEFKQAIAPGERMVALNDSVNPKDLGNRFAARHELADLYYRVGDFKRAEALLIESLSAPYGPSTVGEAMYARSRIQLARIQFANGTTEGIEHTLVDARDVLVRRLGPNEYYVAVANTELGNFYNARADFSRAEAALKAAYASLLSGSGEQHQSTRITALNLAITELNAGDAGAALARLEHDRPWFISEFGGSAGPVVQAIDFERARALSDLHRPAEALKLLEPLSAERLAEGEPARDWAWRLQAEKGRALMGKGEREAGATLLREAVSRMDELGSPKWMVASYRALLGEG